MHACMLPFERALLLVGSGAWMMLLFASVLHSRHVGVAVGVACVCFAVPVTLVALVAAERQPAARMPVRTSSSAAPLPIRSFLLLPRSGLSRFPAGGLGLSAIAAVRTRTRGRPRSNRSGRPAALSLLPGPPLNVDLPLPSDSFRGPDGLRTQKRLISITQRDLFC